jgi:hypothetical protein
MVGVFSCRVPFGVMAQLKEIAFEVLVTYKTPEKQIGMTA